MAKINLIRIDSRLIHGQVANYWIKQAEARRVLIIDDASAEDAFMAQIFQTAAPPGVSVEVLSTKEAGQAYQRDQFGQEGPLLCLFKSVPQMYDAYNSGFTFSYLQLGGIGGGPGRVNVFGPIALDEDDARKLQEISTMGVRIVFQITPQMGESTWASVKSKHFPKI